MQDDLTNELKSEQKTETTSVFGPHAVRIVEVVEAGDPAFKLNLSDLEKILLNPKIADKNVAIIGVAGALRKGKSFLLNFFLRYLRYKSTGTDNGEWLDLKTPLKGFSWKSGRKRDTNGILIWSEPFILKDDNEDMAVILMDTQGAFDSQSTVRDCATIFALSTMISSIQIFNLTQNIQEDDLQHLQFFIEYGRLALESNEAKPFQSLMFLVRDWPYPDEVEFGFEGGQRILDELLQVPETQRSEQQQLRQHIRNYFKKISCFLMPHPGLEFVENLSFDLTEIRPKFQKQLELIVPDLLDPRSHLVAKEINGQKVTCRELAKYFKVYMENFNGQDLPKPESIFRATVKVNNQGAVESAITVYRREMDKVCKGEKKPYLNTKDLNQEHFSAKEAAKANFDNARKMGGKDDSLKFSEKLEADIDKIFEDYVCINDGKNPFKSMRPLAFLVAIISLFANIFLVAIISFVAKIFPVAIIFLVVILFWTGYRMLLGIVVLAIFVYFIWTNFILPKSREKKTQ